MYLVTRRPTFCYLYLREVTFPETLLENEEVKTEETGEWVNMGKQKRARKYESRKGMLSL